MEFFQMLHPISFNGVPLILFFITRQAFVTTQTFVYCLSSPSVMIMSYCIFWGSYFYFSLSFTSFKALVLLNLQEDEDFIVVRSFLCFLVGVTWTSFSVIIGWRNWCTRMHILTFAFLWCRCFSGISLSKRSLRIMTVRLKLFSLLLSIILSLEK